MRRVILGCVAWAAVVGGMARADEPAKAEKPDAKWLQGKWAFDAEHTRRKLAEAEGAELREGFAGLIVGAMMAKVEGTQLRFTEKEVAYLTPDGNGRVEPYEVFEVPDASTVILKNPKGKLAAYHKDGDRLWVSTDGNLKVPFYFKPVKPAAEAKP